MACAKLSQPAHIQESDLLHASGCTLNDSGAELIAEALVDNQTLNTLELPGTAARD